VAAGIAWQRATAHRDTTTLAVAILGIGALSYFSSNAPFETGTNVIITDQTVARSRGNAAILEG
jgi:hypothetical protein